MHDRSARVDVINDQAQNTISHAGSAEGRVLRRKILNDVIQRTEERIRSANFNGFRSRVAHLERNADLRCQVMLVAIGEQLETSDRLISSLYQPEIEDTLSDVIEIDVHTCDLTVDLPPLLGDRSDEPASSWEVVAEAKCLRQWLRRCLQIEPRLMRRPRDATFLRLVDASAPDSVAHLLHRALSDEVEDIAPTRALFAAVGPLNHELVRAGPYLKQCLKQLVAERCQDILVVVDLDGVESTLLPEILGELPATVAAKLVFAVDPVVKRNAAVLIRVTKTD